MMTELVIGGGTDEDEDSDGTDDDENGGGTDEDVLINGGFKFPTLLAPRILQILR